MKTSEKIIIELHRQKKTKSWLAKQLGVSRPTLDRKIDSNHFTDQDIQILKYQQIL